MRNPLVAVFCLLLSAALAAQPSIFPGLSGERLIDSLLAAYKPHTVLSYNDARDLMFSQLNNVGDSVAGVYSGFTVYIDPNSPDPPRTVAFNAGLNTEHTWPQSLGAVGQARSDLHHLFPTRIDVNSDRGSLRFDEIDDLLTDRWYRRDHQQSTPPGQFIDEYSELEQDFPSRFEPREDHKGNVARAIFYFYTMYRHEADSLGPGFFSQQQNVLRTWNQWDPVDAAEITRTQGIAAVQDGKPNPFVLDTTLIRRAYFEPVVGLAEGAVPAAGERLLEQNFPNPFNPATHIRFRIPEVAAAARLTVYDLLGRPVKVLVDEPLLPGGYQVQWDGRDQQGRPVAGGVYLYRLQVAGTAQAGKMLLLR